MTEHQKKQYTQYENKEDENAGVDHGTHFQNYNAGL